MKEEHEDLLRSSRQPLPGFDSGPLEEAPASKPDSVFSGYDEDDDHYEAPDRDTDYAAGFREENVEEDELFDELLPAELAEEDDDVLFEEQTEFLESETQSLAQSPSQDNAHYADQASYADQDTIEALEEEATAEREQNDESMQQEEQAWEEEDYVPSWQEEEDLAEDRMEDEELEDISVSAIQDTHEDQRHWLEEEPYSAHEERDRWPVGLIAVGALALVLVFAGGYGVMQQRAETREEIQELRAALATAASPAEVDSGRAALQEEKERSEQLRAQTLRLERENLRLKDTVAGLESQVAALETTAQKPPPAPAAVKAEPTITKAEREIKAAAPAPAVAPAPTKPAPTATTSTGPWFVNFSSYGQRSAAEAWVGKLKPAVGEVVITQGARDGRTFYRVRVIGLADKAAAQQVARQLEKDWSLSELWVGKQ